LTLEGYDIVLVKEWYPIKPIDKLFFGITAGKTTYVEYWNKMGYVACLISFGSPKETKSADFCYFA